MTPVGGQWGRLSNGTHTQAPPQLSQGLLVLLMLTVVMVLDGVLDHVLITVILLGPCPRSGPRSQYWIGNTITNAQ